MDFDQVAVNGVNSNYFFGHRWEDKTLRGNHRMILYSERKKVNYRQAYACYRKDMNNEQRYCDDTAGIRSDDKGIE